MLPLPRIAILTTCIILAWPISRAAESPSDSLRETGTVTGRVQNVVTEKYLSGARILIKGTDQVVHTDQYGVYRLVGVQSGPVVLRVFYTGLDPQEISLIVPIGRSIEQDVALTSKARYGQDSGTVTLNPFVIGANRETDINAIAVNEQRFAPNIKNVIATDAMGDLLGSSAGEFLKFVPGLSVEYDNADVSAVSVRGLGGALTTFQTDGATVVSGGIGSSRVVEMRTLALNNISRIEVTKVPTPSNPSDSLGGAVNMISKNAFERSGAQLRYGISLVGNAPKNITLDRTPEAHADNKTHKLRPGFDFDYTRPFGKSFGVVVTGLQSSKFNEQWISRESWNAAGTSTGASLAAPFLQQFSLQDVPRSETRTIFSVKADWRITPNSILSVGGRWSRYEGDTGTLGFTPTAGTIGTPAIAGGVPLSYSPNFTIGATGRGNVTLSGGAQHFNEDSYGSNVSYRYDDGKWKLDAGLNHSGANRTRDNVGDGSPVFVTAVMNKPVRVSFFDINEDRPGRIQVFDNDNKEVDPYDIRNYNMSSVSDNPQVQISSYTAANLDVRRRLSVFPFPTAVQLGGLRRVQTLDARRESKALNFTGSNASATQFQYDTYVNQDSNLGFKNLPGISGRKVLQAMQAVPPLYTQTPAQIVSQETFRRTNSEYIEEAVTAIYFQGEARLFKNRLNVVTGVRFEKTASEGQGLLNDPNAVFVRNADGTFARNSQGAQIRKPEAGTVNSIEQIRLTLTERGAQSKRSYEGYYPSLHLNYNFTENFIGRIAYAKTYGRPNFNDVIPNTTIQEFNLSEEALENPDIPHGTITMRNPSLTPWIADNYDISLEYYTDQGGTFSAGAFVKDIKDFFGSSVKIATAADLDQLGLDPKYLGWNLSTRFNSGDARITGIEFNFRHSLRNVGMWGKYFTVFGNATQLKLEGNPYASFSSFIPKTANWGVSYNWKRISVMTKWNYRGLNKLTAVPALGPDGFLYLAARTTLDLSLGYQVSPRLSLIGTVNNVFNVIPLENLNYAADTPAYARRATVSEYGVACAVGLKGTF
jgi:iron complex outermembrane receptor protein